MNLSTVVSLMVVLHALLLCWVANASLSSYQRKRKGHHPSQRDIMIKNLSGGTIDMFWINPETRELTASNFDGGLVYGGESGLNSYIGHSFEVREIPSKRTGKCKMTICRKAYLTVNANEEQIYTINEDFEIIVEDHKTRAMDRAKALVRDCNVNELTLSNKQYESMSPTEQMTQLIACMEKRVNETIKEQQDEISFQREVRHKMAVKLVDYACNDTSLNTTESLRNTTFTYIAGTNRPKALKAKLKQQQESGQKSRGGGGPREMFLVQSLFQSEKNQLLYIENFLSPQECDALLLHSDPQTENTHFIPLDALQQDGLVEVAIEKIEVLIEKYLGKPISYQSDPLLVVSTLRPKGSGAKECMANIAAQGKPKKHKGDTDAAALRIFCETPLVGGSIHFHKVGVQINTVKAQGAALLAIFEDPDTHEREPAEEAFLEDYVECPVQAGDLISVYDHFTF